MYWMQGVCGHVMGEEMDHLSVGLGAPRHSSRLDSFLVHPVSEGAWQRAMLDMLIEGVEAALSSEASSQLQLKPQSGHGKALM